MTRLIKLIFSLLALSSASMAFASHFKGGEIVYFYLGNGNYKIRVNTYFTVSCAAPITHSSASFTITTAFAKVSETDLDDFTTECVFEQVVHYTASTTDHIAFLSAKRITGGSNFSVINAPSTVGDFGLSADIIYSATNDSLNTSSPQFGSLPLYAFSSLNGSVIFSLNASLPSGPSDRTWSYRRFALGTPVGVPASPSPYANMTGFSINPITGTVSWTTPLAGLWLINVKIEETNSVGTLTGAYIYRDFMLTVTASANHAPKIASISSSALVGKSTVTYTLTVSASDEEANDITLTATGSPFSNGATFVQTGTGTPVSGTLTWVTPLIGSYALQFTATDSDGLFSQLDAFVGIDVPIVIDATASTLGTFSGRLRGIDTYNLPLTYTISTQGSHGTATVTDASTGAFTYTATNGYLGADVFGFRASNGVYTSRQASVAITVLSALPLTNPTLLTNAGLSISLGGGSGTIDGAMLQVSDSEQTPAQLVYSLTALPAKGTLSNNGNPLSLVSTFTQDDIDNGLLSYQNTSSASSDSFRFTVSDGQGGTLSAVTFGITISSALSPVSGVPTAVSLGEWTSCLSLTPSSLSCWGDGVNGKIPNFKTPFTGLVSTPSTAFVVDGLSKLSMGRRHGCILRTNGEIACFGEGSAGQIGNGTAVTSSGGVVTVSGFGH